jgi:CheY-like chemotaxis protein/anti-sigma regulatory factor (Ser/Thr protein kinase)
MGKVMGRTALIVEDERDMGLLLVDFLRRWGYEPTLLSQGTPAVAWAGEHQPELILLDLMLPDVDGYDVCRELKLQRSTNLIPIVMVTARSGYEDRVRGLEVGANFYLTKPFTEAQLLRAITEVQDWRDELKRRGAEGEIHFQLRSHIHHLEELNGLLASLFFFTPLGQPQVKQLISVVRELGANAIEWGHQKQVDLPLTVSYHIDSEKVRIVIRDRGPGFNPRDLPHAANGEDPLAHLAVRETLGLREGGFGILMARAMVDELQYNDKGNEVCLVKYFQAGARPPTGQESPTPSNSPRPQ